MLQIKSISKEYVTGELHQTALNNVSLNLRDSEFVAILGPSGSGKTTLLNIIGGLDRYDSGDLIINGISTKKYKNRDWDSYRNHTIGFVFQSYNLIPHQTILANVELALTISGISRGERKRRAKEALEQVGLGDQLHKKPNQMSGGQMQRVAIARALVNNPDILLADEPTGALDTETSVQVMELLKEVSKDRLVVMVTHNPELAQAYATRIVQLRDGKIVGDSDSYVLQESAQEPPKHKNMGKASMSFLTALSLSFNNLRTKKARTLLTAFAGSIGIIGIALILSLSNGVNTYISDIQKDTMTSYPITIDAESMDLSSMLEAGKNSTDSKNKDSNHKKDAVYSSETDMELSSSTATNNLKKFKKYLDDPDSEINKYVGDNGITYSYDTKFSVYTYDSKDTLVGTQGSTFAATAAASAATAMMDSTSSSMSMSSSSSMFDEIMPGNDGSTISETVTDSYDLLYGSWPDEYDEVVLVLDDNNELSVSTLYKLGLYRSSEYKKLQNKVSKGKDVTLKTKKFSYKDICNQTFYLVANCDFYSKSDTGNGTYASITTNDQLKDLMKDGVKVKITGIIRANDDDNASISTAIGYTSKLTDYLIEHSDDSAVVKAQKDTPKTNVLTGTAFSDDEETSYEDNLSTFGYVNKGKPSSINIYADSFEDKEGITDSIDDYNDSVSEENQITYTDYVGLLMSSVTTIVDVISYVLIAFLAVSLVVSSIMIGIITYISVLERTKEIGILRAIGASKRNISQVFNAETIIIGFCSGIIGIGVSLLALIPANNVIHSVLGMDGVTASLPVENAVVLILLSVILTLIGGFIPSKKAARKDPVTALRTE